MGEPRLDLPPGQGGLDDAPRGRVACRRRLPAAGALSDDTFEDRVGWKAIVSAPGDDTAVRTQAPSGDPTERLRRYPEDLLDSPLDRREASFSVTAGDGTLIAPRAEGTTRCRRAARAATASPRSSSEAAAGEGVLFVLLLAAFGWGAVHALSPGHGKAMVAAYLVGTKGKPRHAVALGATVTVAHTVGVFMLGFVTLALSQYILPEDLYPWLNLISGRSWCDRGRRLRRAPRLRARTRLRGPTGAPTAMAPRPRPPIGTPRRPRRARSHARRLSHFMDHLRGREHGHGHQHHRHDPPPRPHRPPTTRSPTGA